MNEIIYKMTCVGLCIVHVVKTVYVSYVNTRIEQDVVRSNLTVENMLKTSQLGLTYSTCLSLRYLLLDLSL